MIKSLEEIKSLSKGENPIALIIDTKDYAFIELLELAKISGLFGWKITYTNCTQLETKELIELAKQSEKLTFDLR